MLFNLLIALLLLIFGVLICKPIIFLARTIINYLESQVLDNAQCFIKESVGDGYQISVNIYFVIAAIFVVAMTSVYFNIAYLILGFLLLISAIIDFERGYLPEVLTTLLLWSALMLSALGFIELPLRESLFGAVSGFSLIFSLDCLLKACKRGGFGSGDAPFLAAIGAWNGPLMVPLVFSLAVLGHPQDGSRKPFGHRLAMAGWACVFLRLIARKM